MNARDFKRWRREKRSQFLPYSIFREEKTLCGGGSAAAAGFRHHSAKWALPGAGVDAGCKFVPREQLDVFIGRPVLPE